MCRIAVDCPGMTLSYLPANINLKGKDSLMAGEVMWFINYYHVKGKTRGEAKTSANKMEDDVLLRCFHVQKDGGICAAKIRFRVVPLQKLCDPRYKVQIKDDKICGFSRNRFLVLKKALLTSLLAERNLQSEMRKAKKQKRIDDMTCPPSLMTRSQVFNECKLRLNESEASIRPRLTSYASILKFTDSEAEKLLLPTLRSILRDLREKPVEGGADGVMH